MNGWVSFFGVLGVSLLATVAACDGDNIEASCEDTGTCIEPSCSDGSQNGTESDIDCGGESCGECASGLACALATDCESGVCSAGMCVNPSCGDGVVQPGELCDDGNGDNFDSCPDGNGGSCRPARCSDGFVWDGVETCDDGNTENGDDCPSGIGGSCQPAVCGDGFVHAEGGGTEQCDDGNGENGDACPDGDGGSCAPASCGDGFVNAGTEECDDGNASNNDACPDGDDGTCASATCGDGFVFDQDGGLEQCDDGNSENGDACPDGAAGTCMDASCGDGFVFDQDGGTEDCDDANANNNDACPDGVNGTCVAATCGDGFVFDQDGGAEQCDDGNSALDDDCPDGAAGTCQDATCDDGFFNSAGTRMEDALDCSATEATCLACPGGLLISEVVTGPTTGEYIEIHNPCVAEVTLSNVYLADFNTYFSETVAAVPNAPANDFLARFPIGSSVPAGATLVISVNTATNYETTYGASILPDFDFDPDDAQAPSMTVLDSGAVTAAKLTDGDEMLVAYFWGGGDLVSDIDYVVWGDTSDAMDKTGQMVGASTYLDDTAVASQAAAGAPGSGQGATRCDLTEGTETAMGGNGVLGHDETSENLATTFAARPASPGSIPTCVVAADVLFISEYGEGSGSNKWLEIVNGGAANIDLSQYQFGFCGNACTDWESFLALPAVSLAPGEVFVVANPNADPAILAAADLTSTAVNFNGNDAIGLLDLAMTALDIIGEFLAAPTNWNVAGDAGAGANSTLMRKCTVTAGNTDWIASAGTDANDSEWVVLAQDDISDIGQHCP